jgi:hypothetical protein
MKILALLDPATGLYVPLSATVEMARAGYHLITFPGIGELLVSPTGEIRRTRRQRMPLQEKPDA